MSTFFDFLLLLLGFSLVIFVHELGHFAVAKWVGIKVEQFAIGMGPAALSWRKGIGFRSGSTQGAYDAALRKGVPASELGETEYRLNYLPLGGYVKMLGQEDLDMAAIVDDPRSYSSRPVWARMCVVSAGVVMNLIFAMVLFVICFMWGIKTPPPIVGGVQPESLAAVTMPQNAQDHGIVTPGIQPGDRVVSINGEPVKTWEQVLMSAALAKPGQSLRVVVDRGGVELTFDLMPREDQQTQFLALGLTTTQSNRIIDFKPGSESAEVVSATFKRAGLDDVRVEPGMVLSEVNGRPVDAVWQLSQAIDESNGQDIGLTFTSTGGDGSQHASLRPDPDFMIAQVQHDSAWYALRHVLGLVPAPSIMAAAPEREGKAGPRAGDIIKRIGDIRWPRVDEVGQVLVPHAVAPMVVLRGGEEVTFEVSVRRNGAVGFQSSDMPATSPPIVADTLSTLPAGEGEAVSAAPAAALNLMPGTRLVSIDGATVPTWRDLFIALRAAVDPDEPTTISLTYELPVPGSPIESTKWTISPEAARSLLALQWHSQLAVNVFEPMQEVQKAANPIEAVQMGFDRTWSMIVTTYQTLDRLVRGTVDVKQLKGPVGIAEIGTQFAGQGLPYLLLFLGIINVNLAVLNFLPIPIVDGGLMVFLIIEKLKGSPVSVQVQNAATVVGLLLIGSLFLVTFYNDVLNLIGNLAS
ncbi:MAG: site-2 protease family protein [Phycisphaerales bacterium]|nr:site-2 protease family protein [Phycisphaerales bacterium]